MSHWKRFRDPSGSYYYFNAVTKVSSRNKPKEYEQWEQQQRELTAPVFCLPLCHSWHLVVCFNGRKFYYNSDSGESQTKLVDEESVTLLARVDNSLLALLVGVARGVTLRDGRDVYQEVYNVLVELKRQDGGTEDRAEGQDPGQTDVQEPGQIDVQEPGQADAQEPGQADVQDPGQADVQDSPEKAQHALVSGYSSSEEEEEEEAEAEEAEEEAEEVEAEAEESRFMDLLSSKNIDPYSTWPLQAKKLLDDPRYHLVPDHKREELFQQWCAQHFEQQKTLPQEDHSDDNTDLNTTKYHYLAHIISKATITPTTIFSDIKKENKRLFKKLQINDQLSKKEQEQFTSKLLAYYKRMGLDERERIFKTTIQSKLNFPPKSDRLSSLVLKDTPNDSFELETQLLEIENELLILDDQKNSSIQKEVMYYVLGIKDKLHALKQVLKDNNFSI